MKYNSRVDQNRLEKVGKQRGIDSYRLEAIYLNTVFKIE